MPDPTFEQDDIPSLGWIGDELLVVRLRRRHAWGSPHEACQAGILELQSRTSSRSGDVVRTAHHRERVQMQTVHGAERHYVDPTIRHAQLASTQIPIQSLGVRAYVALDLGLEIHEGTRHLMNLVERTVRSVPARIILRGPLLPREIILPQLLTLLQQFRIELLPTRPLQTVRVDERWKPRLDALHKAPVMTE